MKLYLTRPFDDAGIEEIDVDDDFNLSAGYYSYVKRGIRCTQWGAVEGRDFHTDRKAALECAAKYRRERIAKLAADLANVTALPALELV